MYKLVTRAKCCFQLILASWNWKSRKRRVSYECYVSSRVEIAVSLSHCVQEENHHRTGGWACYCWWLLCSVQVNLTVYKLQCNAIYLSTYLSIYRVLLRVCVCVCTFVRKFRLSRELRGHSCIMRGTVVLLTSHEPRNPRPHIHENKHAHTNFSLPSGLNLPHCCLLKCMLIALGLFQTDNPVREL